MSDLIRLDASLSVRIAGVVALCPELSLDRFVLVLPAPLPEAEEVDAELLLSDDLSVRARVRGGAVAPDPGGVQQSVDVMSWADDGRAQLTAHISALRKAAHLAIVADQDVESRALRAGWDRIRFAHRALPELDADAIDLRTRFLGNELAAPLVIAGMTGGSPRAGIVNERLAVVAQELGLGMGLGSQRAMLEAPELAPTFQVRAVAPDILLLANIGAVQLNYGVTIDAVRHLIDAVGADALAVHLNVLQEMVQPEGDRNWAGLLDKIGALIEALAVPVIVKETGCGVDATTARRLLDLGISAIDVGGAGGTSWGWIEGFRAADPERQAIGATFRDWGTPTADALRAVAAACPGLPLMATGGVRTGLDVAKAVALGATVAGMALPFFRAADRSQEDALAFGRRIIEEVRIAAVCSGAATLHALRCTEVPR